MIYSEGVAEVNIILITGDGYSYSKIECCGYDHETELFYIVNEEGRVVFPRESVSVFYVKPAESAEVIPIKIKETSM